MKLSTAIRKGCLMTHQIHNKFFDDQGGACVLGAAYIGKFGYVSELPNEFVMDKLCNVFPAMRKTVPHPHTGELTRVSMLVMYMNDQFNHKREDIAKWLEGQDL